MRQELIDRFITYVKVNTQADEESKTCPTTKGQLKLAKIVAKELKEIGMENVTMDANGYVMATLPANTDKKKLPIIGFLAHLDTATEVTGKNVDPRIHENYDGKEIILNETLKVILSPHEFKALKKYKGETLITTDGTTLLGADDKAGIAEIIVAMHYLIHHPEIKHGKIRVAFTPDEEIGRGPAKFDIKAFGADFAYTIDGGPLGELEYENFNAAIAHVHFKGKSVHPGTAKDKMIHATKLALELNSRLPNEEVPEKTAGRDGFYHLVTMNGTVEEANSAYLIRDFDKWEFKKRKEQLETIVNEMRVKYGKENISLSTQDQYYNMKEKIEPVFEIIDVAHQAMENLNIKPLVHPIRGGTDGAQLSFKGLPTPNIFTGGENFHGKYEYISVESMQKTVEVIIEIVRLFGEKAYE